jgi:hypothetical protein
VTIWLIPSAGDSLQFSCQGIELDHFRLIITYFSFIHFQLMGRRKGSFFCDKQALMAPARKLLARVYVFKLEIPIIKGTSVEQLLFFDPTGPYYGRQVIFYFYKNEETGYITRLIETSNKSSGSSVRKNPRYHLPHFTLYGNNVYLMDCSSLSSDSSALIEITLSWFTITPLFHHLELSAFI